LGTNASKRTFRFTFTDLEKEEKEFLKNRADNLAKSLGKVSTKDKKSTFTLTITVKGDKEKVDQLYEKLFGNSLNSEYAVEHKWMGFFNTFAYEETINLSNLIPSGSSEAVDVNYELSFAGGSKVKSLLDNAYEKKGNTLYFSGSTNSSIGIDLYGTKINPRGILSTLFLLLAVVSLVFFFILLLMGFAKKAPTAPIQPPIQPQPVPGAPQAQPQAAPQAQPQADAQPVPGAAPIFCTGCGAKFEDASSMFCIKCGKKRGE
jgi:hypothetical protein